MTYRFTREAKPYRFNWNGICAPCKRYLEAREATVFERNGAWLRDYNGDEKLIFRKIPPYCVYCDKYILGSLNYLVDVTLYHEDSYSPERLR